MKRKNLLALLLVTALVLSLLAGCAGTKEPEETPTTAENPTAESGATQENPTANPDETTTDPGTDEPAKPVHEPQIAASEPGVITLAASYEEIRDALRQAGYNYSGYANATPEATIDDGEKFDGVASDSAAVNAEGGAGGYGGEDFGTNVQVAGIDEADSVKTDGVYIYVVNESDVNILRVDGANTEVVGKIISNLNNPFYDDENGSTYYYVDGLLLRGDKLALIYSFNKWGWDEDSWYDVNETHLAIYDISDVANPRLYADVGQDGSFRSARMKDGMIYLVTTNYISYVDDDAAPESYIPRVCSLGSYSILPAERVYLCPDPGDRSFTIVGSYDLAEGKSVDACAFTGNTDVDYMNADALYLARSVYNEEQSEPYTENQYTVVDHVSHTTTEIKRIPLSGTLEMDKSCEIEGSLLNQFSLDVYNDYLRAATTTYSYSYSVFTDETYGWDNFYWNDDNKQNNRVTILDSNLDVVSILDDLAADERIYSVRFLGDVGYVVTYQSIDPVFTLDLSDPTNPTLESALEVPGVSQYLHLFSDGKLFGFGQAVDENAVSDGLQLSMFAVGDPKNVTLEGKEIIEDSYSEALYNHHAILVNGSLNLIAFPMENYSDWESRYVVYSYENGTFTQRGNVMLDFFPEGARGIAIDGMLYICGGYQTYVIDLSTYQVVASLSEAMG